MLIEHRGARPRLDPTAYVAPNATLSGHVVIGANSSILFGAVITAEGGTVEIGADCVIMENAVLRATPRQPLRVGDRVLVGPHAHVTGCTLESDCFLATGSSVFNGARLHAGTEIRINGVVHVNTVLPPGTTVPIGWVAVGDPARILPTERHDEIWEVQRRLDFPGTVFGVERDVSRGERTRRYSRGLRLHHAGDVVIPATET